MSDKRKSERIKKQIKSEISSEEHITLSSSVDLSNGGVFISTPEPLENGSEVMMSIKLPHDEEVEVKGIVKWIRSDESEGGRAGMGIEFVDLDSSKEEILNKIIK